VQASPDDIKDLKKLFLSLDVNGDGSLTMDELRKGLAGKENAEELLVIM
jgi:Ca2+-binding EF-hand superfamily protein